MYTLQEWLRLDNQELARIVSSRVSTAIIYLNGTRRWFLSRNRDWSDYSHITARAHQATSQLFFDHGIRALVQPLLGYDLLQRGQDYLVMAVEQGLAELATEAHRNWYRDSGIRVSFYGDWPTVLPGLGFSHVAGLLADVAEETRRNTAHSLLFGVFADGNLSQIVTLAQEVEGGDHLLEKYYGQPVSPVGIVVGAGQPAVWDIPLLNINQASLYFLQAPTFCLNSPTLRNILYDHLFMRVNDDELYDDVSGDEWKEFAVLGLGQFTRKGWVAS